MPSLMTDTPVVMSITSNDVRVAVGYQQTLRLFAVLAVIVRPSLPHYPRPASLLQNILKSPILAY